MKQYFQKKYVFFFIVFALLFFGFENVYAVGPFDELGAIIVAAIGDNSAGQEVADAFDPTELALGGSGGGDPQAKGTYLCEPCCSAANCGTTENLVCVGYTPGVCDMTKEKGTGQCQPEGQVTFCPLSTHRDFNDLLDAIFKYILIFALAVAPLFIIWGGFLMLTSQGDPKKTSSGKDIIKWTVIGLAVVLFARAFLSIIRSVIN